jgi:hypothetical protein
LQKLNPQRERIYMFNSPLQMYMLYNQLPPTYFPLVPGENFFPNIDKRIIGELESRHVQFVLTQNPIDINLTTQYPIIVSYIKRNFHKCIQTKDFMIYCK